MSTEKPTLHTGGDHSQLPAHNTPQGGGARRLAGLLIGLIVLGAFFFIGVSPKTKRFAKLKEQAKADSARVLEVPVQTPAPAADGEITLPGTTEAIQDTVVAARSSGYLSKRLVDIGDKVKAGQVLAIIESPDIDQQLFQAQAQVSQSHAVTQQSLADLANKKATVAQLRSGVRQTEANVEQSNAQVADAQAKVVQLTATKASVEAQTEAAKHQVSLKEASVEQAETQRGLAEITYKRYKTLLDGGFVALQDADQAEAAYKTAVSAVTAAQADLKAAQAAVHAAEQQVLSAAANVKSGEAEVVAAEKSLRATQTTVKSAESSVDAALANVQSGQSTIAANHDTERANQFNAKHYSVLTAFEKVTAPFDGVITARNVEVGTLVGGGAVGGSGASTGSSSAAPANLGSASGTGTAPNIASGGGLFGLARTDVIRILVTVPQTYVRAMHAGVTTFITIPEFPGKKFAGVVARVSGALDTNSRTLLTEVHIDNKNGAILPGMFATVHFLVGNKLHQVRIPASALISDALGTRVATVGTDNTIHYIKVKIARDYGTEIDISDGLNGDERLVVAPSDDLVEGATVKPVDAPKPQAAAPAAGAKAEKAKP